MSDEELAAADRPTVNIFARVVPEQKLRIVNALKANGEIVAMTGDGVNDAPGARRPPTSASPWAAAAPTWPARRRRWCCWTTTSPRSSRPCRLGRRIFDNIKKAISYIFAVHVPIAGLSLIPVFFADWPLLLLPVHIVFLELIIDPACSVIFEAEAAEPTS